MFSLLTNIDPEPLKRELAEATNWDDKLSICIRHMSGHVPISVQYARFFVQVAYGRINVARRYVPTVNKLRSKIVFLKANSPSTADSRVDYGLSKYSYQDVTVYDLDSDHGNAPQDLRCSNIVNRHLEDYLLERYSTRNLCETYLINANQFMDSLVSNSENE